MDEFFAEGETETVKQDREHFEVVLLFVAYHINHLINRVILETQLGSSDILSHINRCTIRTEQQFLVQSVRCQIRPYRTILTTVELSGRKSFLYLRFTFEIGIRLVIDLIERHTHPLVGLVKTGINPLVHLRPKTTHFRIVGFPFAKHLLRLFHQRSLLLGGLFVHSACHQLGDLLLVLFVKTHVVITDEVVAFLTAGLRRLAVTELQPCEHGLADMNTTIIDNIGLHYFPSVRLLNLRNRITQQVITHMTQVQRFIGVRRRVLHHHQRMYDFFIHFVHTICFAVWIIYHLVIMTVLIVRINRFKLIDPELITDHKVQKSLHGIVFGDKPLTIFL